MTFAAPTLSAICPWTPTPGRRSRGQPRTPSKEQPDLPKHAGTPSPQQWYPAFSGGQQATVGSQVIADGGESGDLLVADPAAPQLALHHPEHSAPATGMPAVRLCRRGDFPVGSWLLRSRPTAETSSSRSSPRRGTPPLPGRGRRRGRVTGSGAKPAASNRSPRRWPRLPTPLHRRYGRPAPSVLCDPPAHLHARDRRRGATGSHAVAGVVRDRDLSA